MQGRGVDQAVEGFFPPPPREKRREKERRRKSSRTIRSVVFFVFVFSFLEKREREIERVSIPCNIQ